MQQRQHEKRLNITSEEQLLKAALDLAYLQGSLAAQVWRATRHKQNSIFNGTTDSEMELYVTALTGETEELEKIFIAKKSVSEKAQVWQGITKKITIKDDQGSDLHLTPLFFMAQYGRLNLLKEIKGNLKDAVWKGAMNTPISYVKNRQGPAKTPLTALVAYFLVFEIDTYLVEDPNRHLRECLQMAELILASAFNSILPNTEDNVRFHLKHAQLFLAFNRLGEAQKSNDQAAQMLVTLEAAKPKNAADGEDEAKAELSPLSTQMQQQQAISGQIQTVRTQLEVPIDQQLPLDQQRSDNLLARAAAFVSIGGVNEIKEALQIYNFIDTPSDDEISQRAAASLAKYHAILLLSKMSDQSIRGYYATGGFTVPDVMSVIQQHGLGPEEALEILNVFLQVVDVKQDPLMMAEVQLKRCLILSELNRYGEVLVAYSSITPEQIKLIEALEASDKLKETYRQVREKVELPESEAKAECAEIKEELASKFAAKLQQASALFDQAIESDKNFVAVLEEYRMTSKLKDLLPQEAQRARRGVAASAYNVVMNILESASTLADTFEQLNHEDILFRASLYQQELVSRLKAFLAPEEQPQPAPTTPVFSEQKRGEQETLERKKRKAKADQIEYALGLSSLQHLIAIASFYKKDDGGDNNTQQKDAFKSVQVAYEEALALDENNSKAKFGLLLAKLDQVEAAPELEALVKGKETFASLLIGEATERKDLLQLALICYAISDAYGRLKDGVNKGRYKGMAEAQSKLIPGGVQIQPAQLADEPYAATIRYLKAAGVISWRSKENLRTVFQAESALYDGRASSHSKNRRDSDSRSRAQTATPASTSSRRSSVPSRSATPAATPPLPSASVSPSLPSPSFAPTPPPSRGRAQTAVLPPPPPPVHRDSRGDGTVADVDSSSRDRSRTVAKPLPPIPMGTTPPPADGADSRDRAQTATVSPSADVSSMGTGSRSRRGSDNPAVAQLSSGLRETAAKAVAAAARRVSVTAGGEFAAEAKEEVVQQFAPGSFEAAFMGADGVHQGLIQPEQVEGQSGDAARLKAAKAEYEVAAQCEGITPLKRVMVEFALADVCFELSDVLPKNNGNLFNSSDSAKALKEANTYRDKVTKFLWAIYNDMYHSKKFVSTEMNDLQKNALITMLGSEALFSTPAEKRNLKANHPLVFAQSGNLITQSPRGLRLIILGIQTALTAAPSPLPASGATPPGAIPLPPVLGATPLAGATPPPRIPMGGGTPLPPPTVVPTPPPPPQGGATARPTSVVGGGGGPPVRRHTVASSVGAGRGAGEAKSENAVGQATPTADPDEVRKAIQRRASAMAQPQSVSPKQPVAALPQKDFKTLFKEVLILVYRQPVEVDSLMMARRKCEEILKLPRCTHVEAGLANRVLFGIEEQVAQLSNQPVNALAYKHYRQAAISKYLVAMKVLGVKAPLRQKLLPDLYQLYGKPTLNTLNGQLSNAGVPKLQQQEFDLLAQSPFDLFSTMQTAAEIQISAAELQPPRVLEDGGNGVAAAEEKKDGDASVAEVLVAANNPPRAPVGYGTHSYAARGEAAGREESSTVKLV